MLLFLLFVAIAKTITVNNSNSFNVYTYLMKEKMNKEPQPLTAHAENTRLLKEAKLTLEERVDLYTLVGHIDDEDTPHDGITLNMYLTGEADWRQDFKKIFKREAGIRKPKKAYKLDKIKKVVVK